MGFNPFNKGNLRLALAEVYDGSFHAIIGKFKKGTFVFI